MQRVPSLPTAYLPRNGYSNSTICQVCTHWQGWAAAQPRRSRAILVVLPHAAH